MSKRAGFITFTAIMLGLFILAVAPPHVTTSQATPTTQRMSRIEVRECRFQGMQPPIWSTKEVKRTIRCAAEVWPVSLETAFYVADRESNYHHGAWNPSGACGIYQHLSSSPDYWTGRVRSFLRHTGPRFDIHNTSCHNARANVLVTIRMASRSGWGPWSL